MYRKTFTTLIILVALMLAAGSCSEFKKKVENLAEKATKEKEVNPFVGTWRVQAEFPKHTIKDEDGKVDVALKLDGVCTFEENGSESGKMEFTVEMKVPRVEKFTMTINEINVKGTWRQEGNQIVENKSDIAFDMGEVEIETNQGGRMKEEIYKYLMQNDDKIKKQITKYLFTEDPSTILEQDANHFILQNKDFNSGEMIKFVYTRKVVAD